MLAGKGPFVIAAVNELVQALQKIRSHHEQRLLHRSTYSGNLVLAAPDCPIARARSFRVFARLLKVSFWIIDPPNREVTVESGKY